MAVFICESCGSTLKKQQVDKHCQTKCRGAWHFTCVECGKTMAGFEYKEHNECMTEVEKFQGKFLARLREEKEQAKLDKKVGKHEKQSKLQEDKTTDETVKEKEPKTNNQLESIPEKEALHLRKFLKDGTEFKGIEKTIVAILKYNQDRKNQDGRIKLKEAASMISKVYRLSEDYDSDSSADEDD